MHFIIDTDNNIENFHIEQWDSRALGQTLITEIETYVGKNYEKFILLVLKKKLFLKLRILYSMGEESIVFLWESSPLYGNSDDNRTFELLLLNPQKKYARFYLKAKEHHLTNVFYEARTSKHFVNANRESKDLTFELPDAELIEISNAFNISRNNDNCIYILDERERGTERLLRGSFAGTRFVVIDKTSGELKILTKNEVENITPEKLTEYAGLISTVPHDQGEADEMEITLEKIKKMHKGMWKWHKINQ